ncbi:MAG TPA: flagellar filament outer layer protein FlaA [Treponemataceae bacterium]|nr:flagellar filament outer layer protein FlaA [Treponemataceae bacterium]HQL03666.1 flagellar filament outer layer protein FlaA [Treponemataceae bacterium]
MKRTFILVVMAFLLIGSFMVAEEATIIDFTILDADIIADENGNPTQNRRSVMNYGVAAGATFTDEQKALMKTSLSLPSWEVVLNSSAKTVVSLATSTVVAAPVRENAKVPFAGKNVMGVRILFPSSMVNSNAYIKPAFEIPAYEPMATADDNGEIQPQTDEEKASGKTRFEEGYGIVKNVGTVKALSVTTMGMNFPHALYVVLKDTDSVERRYFMGYLGFDGWRELKWNNPEYVSEIRQREIRVVPIYPRGLPFIKFIGFQVTRDAMHNGGDFIGYFKDVKVIFDKAVLSTERDIADEDLWGIIGAKETAKQNYEMAKFGDKQVLRFLEKDKMAQEEAFTSSLSEEQDQQ